MQEFIWSEKYRPKTIDDCILPERLKKLFEEQVKSGEIQSMILSGGPGIGKTTVAQALCDQLGINHMLIPASEDNGIQGVRTTIRNYASAMSFDGRYKVIILDEADGLSPEAQKALRGSMNEFSKNCKFILTCNFKSKLIEALQSRCPTIDFNLKIDERPVMAGLLFNRIKNILKDEQVEYEDKVLAKIVKTYFPDFRRTINEVQRIARANSKLDAQSLADMNVVRDMSVLMKSLKDKDFKEMRKWVASNMDNEPTHLYRTIFDNLNDYTKPDSVPMACLIIAKYLYQAGLVADQEINLTACLTELMVDCEYQ